MADSTADLAARKAQVTKDAILDGLVRLIVKEGVHGFAVQRVADEAQVTHRTVYRHFPSREALLEGLAACLQEYFRDAYRVVGDGYPRTERGALGALFERTYALFEHQRDRVTAYVRIAMGTGIQPTDRRDRGVWMASLVRDHAPHLDEADVASVACVLRALGSSTTWLHLRSTSDVTPDQLGRGVRWAVDTLMAALEDGRGPTTQETQA